MEVVRKIVAVINHHIEIELPEDFTSAEAEVIVLAPIGAGSTMEKQPFNPDEFFGAISVETAKEMLKDVEQSRNEWERNF